MNSLKFTKGMADGLGKSPKVIVGFPAEVCEFEKRRWRKVSPARDQVAHLAFGAETRMRSNARGYP